MSDRSNDMSDLQLVGGSIKLTERHSTNSHSSALKRYHLSRLSSRPSSAIARLCSGDNMLDDFAPTKNDQRPYSADFATSTLLSGKSKETLSDGSFESIYSPFDCRLSSSNLFKELLEEDVDQWRSSDVKSLGNVNSKVEKNNSVISVPVLSATEPKEKGIEGIEEVNMNQSTESVQELNNTKEVIEKEYCSSNSFFTGVDHFNALDGNSIGWENKNYDQVVEENKSGNKYNLTPGLTTKPPLPKKSITAHAMPVDVDRMHESVIYDYFAIKYNLPLREPISLTENAEKLIHEKSPDEVGTEKSEKPNIPNNLEDRNTLSSELGNNKIDTLQGVETVENLYKKRRDENSFSESSSSSCLEEVTLNDVKVKKLEMNQHYMNENLETKREKNIDFPLLSEIDIDELFRLDDDLKLKDENKVLKFSQNISHQPSSNSTRRNSVNLNKGELGSTKTSKLKFSSSKKPASHRISEEKGIVNNKTTKEKKPFSKAKFIAMPIKLPKARESPRHKENVIEDNIETWINSDLSKPVRRHDFADLISKVEDLKCTTDMITNDETISIPQLDDKKQGDFDEIETIIEALEYQDQTSQNNIKTLKKIVTNELSNSLILNENENNLKYKRKNNITEGLFSDVPSESASPLNDNDSGLVSPTELYADSLHTNTSEKTQKTENRACTQNKNDSVNQDTPQNDIRHQYFHMCGNLAKPPGCLHNYKELLTYLDEVDKKCTKTLEVARERAQAVPQLVLESSNLFDTIPKVEDLVTHTPEQLASYIIDISLRVKDKTSCIGLLQSELSSLRDKLLTQTKQAEMNLRQKLKDQKEETERITKRHQKFIDQLMEEKKTFARRCEELVDEMTTMEEKYVSNMRAIEHKHQVEMQKMRDMHAASEKLRRERWIEGRTQKIKEMAVKSIEPEVERMEKRHQDELSNLRSVHKREIEELELRAARKLQEHSEALREQLIQDREKALAHERDVMRLRYEKMVESEERDYQEQRRRLIADHANRVADCEERETQAAADKERAIKQAQEEFEEKLQAAIRRHGNEMKLVKESAVIELENWKNSFRKQQSTLLMEKETTIRKECRKDRDREIESVIDRLETEANSAKTQLEQTTENRIKRLRDKYEAEIRDLEMLEKDAQSKYSETRSKLIEYEDAMLNLRTTIKQLETQLTEEKLERSKLESEREEIRKVIRKEYEDKMQSLEREVEELRTSADKQVEQLYSRVRVSLARKDDLLEELTNDQKALKEKCLYLESMIEQQRKEFMINS